MTDRALVRAIIGPVIPNRGAGLDDIPEPYRTTVQQARALVRLQGSASSEPREAEAPISENPTK